MELNSIKEIVEDFRQKMVRIFKKREEAADACPTEAIILEEVEEE